MMKILPVIAFTVALSGGNEINLKEFTTGNRDFTADVYKNLAGTTENFLFSPLSIQTVLAVAQSGATTETGREIRKILHLPNSLEKVETVFKHLTPKLKGRKSYTLINANKIYVQNDFAIKQTFLEMARKVYQCPMENVDFAQSTRTAEIINKWVEKKTNNKIHNIVDPSSLVEDLTKAILVNAVYFKGEWWNGFPKYSTQKRSFFKTPEETLEVDMMHHQDNYGYFESDTAKFLKLGFKGCKKAQMVVVLPKKKDGLEELERHVDRVLITPMFRRAQVDVVLPKFRIETEINFFEMLKKMGMEKALGGDGDFSGIAGEKGQLQISQILQKTFIDVREGGVEAAATTTVHFQSRSFIQHVGEKKSFVADHPFLFYIKIKNVIVFAGRVVSPSS